MVTKEQIKHLGWLARIELTDSELDRYTIQIESIIKYLDKLDLIASEDVKPIVAKKKFSDLRQDKELKFDGDALGTRYRKDNYVKGPRMV